MQVLILGTSDAFTTRGFGSSALIRGPGGLVLLDCPDPIHRIVAEASTAAGWEVGTDQIDDILLTHLHGDHCNGLESFALRRALLRLDHPDAPLPRLHCDRRIAHRLWPKLAPALDAVGFFGRSPRLEDFFEIRPLQPEVQGTAAGLGIECRPGVHPVPTIGFRITGSDWKLGWSGDTRFDAQHLDWLLGADLIVHECNRGPAHTSIESLNTLPDAVRARLRLIHLPDDFDASSTDIRPLRPGSVLSQPQ